MQDDSPQDLQSMGIAPEAAAAWLQAQRPEDEQPGPDLGQPTEVWPQNWPAVTLFLRMQTQWRRDAAGRREGLRFEALQAALWLMGCKPKKRRRLFDEVVDMQNAALEVLNGV